MMEAESIISIVTGLCGAGGIIYLIVDKWLTRRESRASVKHQEVENKKETVEYGITMVSIYNEIDKIVESKTRPIQDKLDHALVRIDDLEKNWCCFREDCYYRARSRKELLKHKTLTDAEQNLIRLQSKTEECVCKSNDKSEEQ